MKICKRCLYASSHPLNITFNEEGICSGCLVHEEKDTLDWQKRGKLLEGILENYRNTSGNNYDCIIPVSGGRDSYFIVDLIKNKYGMNPLLVTYNKQYNTDIGIHNLANLRIAFNCDIMTLTVNPETVKKITRSTFRQIGSIYWHCIAGQTVYPVQMAVKFKVPLIIWGAHQGIDQVGMYSHLDEVEMTRKYRKEHDLMGMEAEDLTNDFDPITYEDIRAFTYPQSEEIERVGVRGIYLNNYVRWDTKAQHEQMISRFGYKTAPQTGTFDNYNDVDCFNYSDVHDYIKYAKWGYGKVFDHSSREIRFKRLQRQTAIELLVKFKNKVPQNLGLFTKWLGISEKGFHFIVDQHRNKSVWERNQNWEWVLKNDMLQCIMEVKDYDVQFFDDVVDNINFPLTEEADVYHQDDKYILIGKGYKEGCNV